MRVMRHVCLSISWFIGVHAFGQFSTARPDMVEFRGRVAGGGYSSYNNLVVEITSLRDRTIREHVDVASDGSFGFRAVPQGDYELRVTSIYGTDLTSTIESIGPGSPPVEVRLQQPMQEKPVSGTVTVAELTPLSKQVRKLLESGHKLLQEEHYDDAVARFREAAKDDPNCPQAHADLGMALTKTGDWGDATQEYRAAIVLDPTNSILHSNLSAALAVQKRYGEAQNEALAALKLDSRNARAHYVLGAILLQTQGSTPAAVAHLVASQDAFPSVKETVAKICSANHLAGCP